MLPLCFDALSWFSSPILSPVLPSKMRPFMSLLTLTKKSPLGENLKHAVKRLARRCNARACMRYLMQLTKLLCSRTPLLNLKGGPSKYLQQRQFRTQRSPNAAALTRLESRRRKSQCGRDASVDESETKKQKFGANWCMSGNLLEVHAADLLAVTSDLADARAAAAHQKTTFRFEFSDFRGGYLSHMNTRPNISRPSPEAVQHRAKLQEAGAGLPTATMRWLSGDHAMSVTVPEKC